jgi:hypothetical protein
MEEDAMGWLWMWHIWQEEPWSWWRDLERERPLGRLRYRWERKIKMVLKNQGGGGAWNEYVWHRVGTRLFWNGKAVGVHIIQAIKGGGAEVQLLSFFNLGTRWRSGHTMATLLPGIYWTGGSVGPQSQSGHFGVGNLGTSGFSQRTTPCSTELVTTASCTAACLTCLIQLTWCSHHCCWPVSYYS